MMKLFTPINIGPLELSHRVTFDCATDPRTHSLVEDRVRRTLDRLPSGTLIFVQVGSPMPVPSGAKDVEISAFSEWRRLIDDQHYAGRIVVGRLRSLQPPCRSDAVHATSGLVEPSDLAISDMAKRMQEVRFDGLEYDCTDAIPFRCSRLSRPEDNPRQREQQPLDWLPPFASAIAQLSSVWAVERMGVRLAPFLDGQAAPPIAFAQALELLSDHEVAYTHVTGLCAAGESVRSVITSEAGRSLRRVFPNVMLASGHLDIASAAEAVERRWADGICLPLGPGIGEPSVGEVIRILNQHR